MELHKSIEKHFAETFHTWDQCQKFDFNLKCTEIFGTLESFQRFRYSNFFFLGIDWNADIVTTSSEPEMNLFESCCFA